MLTNPQAIIDRSSHHPAHRFYLDDTAAPGRTNRPPYEVEFFALLERLPPNREFEALLALREWIDAALDLAKERRQLFSHETPPSFRVGTGR